jgi:integrase
MKARPTRSPAISPATRAGESILLNCQWHDPAWTLKPTNALEQEHPERVLWDFELPSGRRFTDPTYAALLETSRAFIALIRLRSLGTGLASRASTAAGYWCYLRILLGWMDEHRFTRFADLDASDLKRFQLSLAQRCNPNGRKLAPTTIQKYLHMLVYLYRYRAEIGDGLTVDPCPGQSSGLLAGVRENEIPRLPYTPDAIAVPLIQRAIDFLESGACDLLRAREVFATVVTEVRRRGHTAEVWRKASARALERITLSTHRGAHPIGSAAELARLLDMLYVACFVVISYLVGARASEILQLRVGCVQTLTSYGEADAGLTVIQGAIFKREAQFHGRPHQWVAPATVVHAIAVLEALSAPHRARSGRDELWLRARPYRLGASEWHHESTSAVRVTSTHAMAVLLRRAVPWFDLPAHNGKPWRPSTHQGRKTFVRFAALRDRTALFAIAQHLGHRERGVTDYCYAGTDHVLNREIDREILEQSVTAWEEMLSARRLGGRAGAEVLAKRPRFRGQRVKQDLKRYARTLANAGLTLGVCDWGFCVYRQDHSACLGSTTAPNPVRREPSTCASCRNFAVGPQHLAYWQAQVSRHEALLNDPALPRQTLQIARERLREALAIVRSCDPSVSSRAAR